MTDQDFPQVALTRLADVQPEQVAWLWPGRIPVGKLVTLDGDPGLGKSTLALAITATITTAGTWPDGSLCAYPGAVLLMSAEDGLADTVRPRLDAAGADVTKVHAVDGVPIDTDGTLRPPTLADVQALKEAITRTGARLLVIDVVMAYLPAGTIHTRIRTSVACCPGSPRWLTEPVAWEVGDPESAGCDQSRAPE